MANRRTGNDRAGRLPLNTLTLAIGRNARIDVEREHHEERVFEILSDSLRPLNESA
jgi:hypothetical protein